MVNTSSLKLLIGLMLVLVLRGQEQPQREFNKESLTADFNSIDKNKDGFIDAHELRRAIPNIMEDDITAFFDRYDNDRNAVITLQEYLMILHVEGAKRQEQQQQQQQQQQQPPGEQAEQVRQPEQVQQTYQQDNTQETVDQGTAPTSPPKQKKTGKRKKSKSDTNDAATA